MGASRRGSAWHAPVSGGVDTWRGTEGQSGCRRGAGVGEGVGVRAGCGRRNSVEARTGGGQCGGGPGSVRTGWLPRAHGSQGSDGSPAAAPDAALPQGRRTMGWLPAPIRRPPPLPSTLPLLGFLFLAAVVLPQVAAEPEPKPQQGEEYYDVYGEYCPPP